MEHREHFNSPEKPDGERWLDLLGLGHLRGLPTGYAINGVPVMAENFDQLCGEHARPILTAIENMDPNDPRYIPSIELAKKVLGRYFK